MTVRTRPAPYAGWRALAATVLVMSGATVAHTWAGGHVPSVPGLVLLAGVVLATSWLLLRGTATWRALLPAVVAAQAGLHTSYAAMSGHATHGAVVAEGATPWSGRMLLAHAAVVVLTAAVWRMCERAGATVVRLLALPTAYGAAPVVTGPAPRAGLPSMTPGLRHSAPRRGPPAALGCA